MHKVENSKKDQCVTKSILNIKKEPLVVLCSLYVKYSMHKKKYYVILLNRIHTEQNTGYEEVLLL